MSSSLSTQRTEASAHHRAVSTLRSDKAAAGGGPGSPQDGPSPGGRPFPSSSLPVALTRAWGPGPTCLSYCCPHFTHPVSASSPHSLKTPLDPSPYPAVSEATGQQGQGAWLSKHRLTLQPHGTRSSHGGQRLCLRVSFLATRAQLYLLQNQEALTQEARVSSSPSSPETHLP